MQTVKLVSYGNGGTDMHTPQTSLKYEAARAACTAAGGNELDSTDVVTRRL